MNLREFFYDLSHFLFGEGFLVTQTLGRMYYVMNFLSVFSFEEGFLVMETIEISPFLFGEGFWSVFF